MVNKQDRYPPSSQLQEPILHRHPAVAGALAAIWEQRRQVVQDDEVSHMRQNTARSIPDLALRACLAINRGGSALAEFFDLKNQKCKFGEAAPVCIVCWGTGGKYELVINLKTLIVYLPSSSAWRCRACPTPDADARCQFINHQHGSAFVY